MRRELRFTTVLLFALLAACNSRAPEEQPSATPNVQKVDDQTGNLILLISNQSFARGEIDIRVKIDDVEIVDETFHVENQHNWKSFPLLLDEGTHRLWAQSQRGEASLETTFTLTGRKCGVLIFWYNPDMSGAMSKPHFEFRTQDPPFAIM